MYDFPIKDNKDLDLLIRSLKREITTFPLDLDKNEELDRLLKMLDIALGYKLNS